MVVEIELKDQPSLVHSVLHALRPHQWTKNLLVFVPMLAAHDLDNFATWLAACSIFVAFCATASGAYIFNDLTDLADDRRHPQKRLRPLASGALPAKTGIGLAGLLIVLGFAISATVGALPVIMTYAVVSVSYSLALKKFPLVDVFTLSALYTLRLLAGGLATGHPVSVWLLGFSGFLFLSLALLKRTREIMTATPAQNNDTASRRGYRASDLTILQMLGSASAFASSVVLALFVGSTAASAQYQSPALLWPIVPLILFWLCRLWLLTVRGSTHDDPLIYVARDWVSWILAGAALTLYTAASLDSISLLRVWLS